MGSGDVVVVQPTMTASNRTSAWSHGDSRVECMFVRFLNPDVESVSRSRARLMRAQSSPRPTGSPGVRPGSGPETRLRCSSPSHRRITSMRVSNRTTVGDSVTCFDAEAGVGFKFLSERFSTRITRDANDRTIDIALLKGPFKRLNCRWKFDSADKGCRASLDMDFEFKNPFLDGFLRANFDKAVSKLMACFEGRAATLYPKTA